jgi:superfamily II DNA/RNA helicase
VVGTPGRLLDHIGRRTLDPSTIEILVLDEVDRMYDLGFRDDVDRIMGSCANRRQTILVSATLNDDVEMLIAKHMGRHERIEIESKTLTVDEVQQTFYVIEPDRKREMLAALIRDRKPDRTIVFTRTRFTADRVAYVLQQEGFDAQEIHSGLPQRRREAILDAFRKGKLDLLIATDVAARGLDIQGVDHVINYDIPQAAEDYVHRVGRTARMGEKGWAVTFVTPDDGAFLTQIEKLINKEIKQQRFQGFGPPAPSADAPEAAEAEGPPKPKSRGIPRWSKPARKRR